MVPESVAGPAIRYCLIVGPPRSGTTLLRSILGEHPRLHVIPVEPHYILGLYERFGDQISDIDEAVRYLTTHRKFSQGPVSVDAFRSALPDSGPLALSDLVDQLSVLTFGDALDQDAPVIVKHPALVLHLPDADRWFGQPLVLSCVRDPRAMVASHRARWPSKSVVEAARLWRDSVVAARRWGDAHSDRYLEVTFEALVTDPEAMLKRVTSLLDVDYVPDMVAKEFDQMQWNSAKPGVATVERLEGLVSDKVADWRSTLDAVDIAVVERICREPMAVHGYRPDDTALGLTQKSRLYARAAGGVVRSESRRALMAWRRRASRRSGYSRW